MDDDLMEQLSYRLYDLQMQEKTKLPQLQAQLAEVEEKMENILVAIEKGIILNTTKKRLADLEARQKELQIEIAQEQINSPILTREQIHFLLCRFRKTDISTTEGKRAIINSFLSAVYLYDDYGIVTCNYKEGSEQITFEDIENSELSSEIKNIPEQGCSDISDVGDPFEVKDELFSWSKVTVFDFPL